jgi:anti-sigma regulatory factor (Ser/Thr protein kinase)
MAYQITRNLQSTKTSLLVLSLLFVLLYGVTNAQQPIIAHTYDFHEYSIEQISLEQGLSQGMVYSMMQDHHGYIWAATKDGLNRYDGTGFKVFRHNPDDSLSISDNTIHSVIQDNRQQIWVGTATAGINLFDAATETFIRFMNEPGKPQILPSNTIGAIQKDGKGNLVFEVPGYGYVVIIEKPGKHKTLKDAFEIKPIEEVYPQLSNIEKNGRVLNRICFSLGGDAWYFKNDTIFGITAEMLQKGEHSINFSYSMKESFNGLINPPFIFHSKKNCTYIISQRNILKRFDAATKTFVPVLQLPEGKTFNASVFIDDQERLWSWLDDESIVRVKLSDGKMTIIRPIWNLVKRGLIYPYEFAFEGMHHNIWVRTKGYGIYKISARSELFKKVPSDAPKVHQQFWSHRIEQPGINTSFDSALTNQWISLANRMQDENKDIQLSFAYHVLAYNKGYYWTIAIRTSTRERYVVRINKDIAKPELEIITSYTNPMDKFGRPFFFDKGGDLWVGAPKKRGAPALIHIRNNEYAETDFVLAIDPSESEHCFISDFYVDKAGLFWLGTIKGLFSFDPITKETHQLANIPGDESSLSKDFILSLCPDPAEPERFLWVGTEGGGLNKFDIRYKTFIRFDTEDGLPNNVIYAIQSDSRNNLWISTNNGICHFNTKTLAIRNFTKADGLVSNEFNRFEFSKAADGTLYFGSPEGVNYFHPEDFYSVAAPSKVVINKLALLNKAVVFQHQQTTPEHKEFKLPAPIEYCKDLVFNYDHRMITLGFTVLDFTVPEQNHFKYMLEGFDEDWIDVGTKNEATYTNLSPGNYTFKVMGCNSNNVWSEPTKLYISVLPPWWATWWFRTIALVAFASFLYGLYRYRMSHLIGMERMRNRIAQDLHDEIGSTLSSISLYSAVMQKTSIKLPQKTSDILSKIINSTSEIMEKMNDMVWTIKSDNDNFNQVVNRMRAFAVNMTETKNIALHFSAEESTEYLKLDMDKRKNIYLIFKEAVNNATKYSKCKNLYIRIYKNADNLKLEIIDDGVGFDFKNKSDNSDLLGGNGLKNIKYRAKELKANLEISSVAETGTTILLTISINH